MQRKTRFLRLCKCKHSNTLGNTEGKRYGAAGAKLSGVGRSRTQRNQCCLQDWFGCMERHWHCVCIFLAFCFDFDFLFPLRFCFFRYFLQFFSVKHEFISAAVLLPLGCWRLWWDSKLLVHTGSWHQCFFPTFQCGSASGKFSVKNQGNRSRNMQKYENGPENSENFRLRRAKENKRTRKHSL